MGKDSDEAQGSHTGQKREQKAEDSGGERLFKNPVPYGDVLSLNVDMDDSSISMELAASVAEYFDMDKKEAYEAADEIAGIVRENWEKLAEKCGLSAKACEYMRPAFEMGEVKS